MNEADKQQSVSEQPRERLVSKPRYLKMFLVKVALYSSAFLLFAGACVFLCTSLFFNLIVLLMGNPGIYPDGMSKTSMLLLGGCFAAVCLAAIWVGRKIMAKAENIEVGVPITRHNTGDLPTEETLVRASDLPPSHRQSEMLRAVKPGQETPAEELLRAGFTRKEE